MVMLQHLYVTSPLLNFLPTNKKVYIIQGYSELGGLYGNSSWLSGQPGRYLNARRSIR